MNMVSLDVTDIPDAARGDVVTLISPNPQDPNSVRSMARLAGTTPYVIPGLRDPYGLKTTSESDFRTSTPRTLGPDFGTRRSAVARGAVGTTHRAAAASAIRKTRRRYGIAIGAS